MKTERSTFKWKRKRQRFSFRLVEGMNFFGIRTRGILDEKPKGSNQICKAKELRFTMLELLYFIFESQYLRFNN